MATSLMALGLTTSVEVASVGLRRDKERELLFIGGQFRAALERYRAVQIDGNTGHYPSTLDELVADTRLAGQPRRHLRKVYVDPMTGRTEWGLVYAGAEVVGVHSLSSLQPVRKDGFPVQEDGFRNARTYRDWVFAVEPR